MFFLRQWYNRKLLGFAVCVLATLVGCSIANTQTSSDTLKFWPRGNLAYLISGSSTPLWPELPKDSYELNEPLVLVMEMPKGFEIVAFGKSTAFALHPEPLIVPAAIESTCKTDKVIYRIKLPASPTALIKDNRKLRAKDLVARAALLINPGRIEPGEYPIKVSLGTEDGRKKWADLNATAHVLPPLKGQRPKRMRVEVFDYAGYTNADYRKGLADVILASGINNISNMRYYDSNDTIAQQLRKYGVKANLLLFWHNIGMEISKSMPEILTVDADGNPIEITHGWPVVVSICHTWAIQNREKMNEALIKYLEKKLVGRYDGVINDNEEKAFTKGRKQIRGDLYTPITMELFRKRAGVSADVELTPEVITAKYAEEWIDFRCWQSAQMSSIFSKAVSELDPTLTYGYYSGHKYVGELAGFTRYMYATDWELLVETGGLHFGSSGYYGSIKDYAATTEALGDIPHIPAEMFIENFSDFVRPMPAPEEFSYRLMNSLMYGSGGFAVWYMQVLDGAGFYAISKVSAIAAEIEDFLLDGQRCDEELVIPPAFDKKAVFAYRLGARKLVVVINHSAKAKNVRLTWRKPIAKPNTVEIVTSRNLAASGIMDAKLPPKGFAVFVTLSEGN